MSIYFQLEAVNYNKGIEKKKNSRKTKMVHKYHFDSQTVFGAAELNCCEKLRKDCLLFLFFCQWKYLERM